MTFSNPVIVRPQAVDEIDEIASYIAKDNLEAALRFYSALEEALEKLAWMPGMGTIREVKSPELSGLRSWPIKRFRNYIVFYLPISTGGIDVVHVLHGARNIEGILNRN